MLLDLLKTTITFLTVTWLLLLVSFPFASSSSSSIPPTTMLTAPNTTKPGCPRNCGNLTIPYPFGIGRHCAMSDAYIIICSIITTTTKNNNSKALIFNGTQEIYDISETQLTVPVGPIASSCTTSSSATPVDDMETILDLVGQPYAISSTENKFVVTGCHHYVKMEADTWEGKQEVLRCVALCTYEADLHDTTCSGIGCCQAPLPKGPRNLTTSLLTLQYDTSVVSVNCSYAFIVKNSSFKFHGAFELQDKPRFARRVANLPLVLDWFVANSTCKDVQGNSTTYACQKNTVCIDLDRDLNVHGYRCRCRPGYEGNPYLSPGCTDINECAGANNCSGICTNSQGSYSCSCPSGYQGDGRIFGTGCRPKSSKSIFALGLGISLASILFLLAGFWILIFARRRKKIMRRAKNFKRNGGLLLQQQMSSNEGMIENTRIFGAEELEKATDHFNENRVLGQGGQGTVYKGMLSDGNIVAIKKSKIAGSDRHLREFINEVVILSQINHRNIVKLLGCCLETEVPLLVYEFIPNGALSKYIHDPSEDFPVTWEMRLQIATDVAGALAYLHSASSKPIFHRDIKTSNILLDAKYRAKLSDFGTSRSIAIDQTHLTTQVQGTFGYLDPEYFRSSHYTEKSDVYSFGVVLVELLTGQKAIRPTESPSKKSLVSWFLSTMENSETYDILADGVAKEGRKETILAIANLAKRCLNIDGKQRPTMREVTLELEVISPLHNVPISSQKNPPEAIELTLTCTEEE